MISRNDLHKLVSLTFDERPSIRKQAAQRLAEIDDPAAIFALVELSYDKDADVKAVAQDIIQKKKTTEREVFSFAEIFGPKEKPQLEATSALDAEQRRERVLSPITRLFEKKLGKERADAIKSKMMPTIEKIYTKTKIGSETSDDGKRAIQEILTSYLEAIGDVGSSNNEEVLKSQTILLEQGEKVGEVDRELEMPFEHKITVEDKEQVDEETELLDRGIGSTAFRKAYELMAFSKGDEKVMRKEMNRLLSEFKKDIKIAFQLAQRRFKENKITSLTRIKYGMRNITTEFVRIKSLERVECQKKRKKETLIHVVIYDEHGNSASLYLTQERAEMLKIGLVIKIERAQVKRLPSLGSGLVLSQKSNIYIVL